LRKATIRLVTSIRVFVRNSIKSAHETNQLALEEYTWIWMLEDFLKFCHGNSGFI